jgi:hypothetical protein
MPIAGTVPLSGPIAPSSTSDTYFVTDPQYGLGGLRTVTDITARNDIPSARRQQGMIVYVIATEKYYSLVGGTGNQDWIEFSGDSGYFAITNPQDGDVLIYANASTAFANNPKETLTDGGTF